MEPIVQKPDACPLLRERMQLIIERKQKPSSVTGLSLVLFLFLSMLSMMAAYEAGKPTDDLRANTIVSLNEHVAPGADTESDNQTLPVGANRLKAPALRKSEYSPGPLLVRVALVQRAFDARAPPAQTAPAS